MHQNTLLPSASPITHYPAPNASLCPDPCLGAPASTRAPPPPPLQTDQQAVSAADVHEALAAESAGAAPVLLPEQQQVGGDRHVLVDELVRVRVLRPDLDARRAERLAAADDSRRELEHLRPRAPDGTHRNRTRREYIY